MSAAARDTPNVRAWVAAHLHFREQYAYLAPLEAIVAEHGVAYESVPWTTWRGRGYRRGRVRECYRNAFQHAYRDDLTYVEGLAFSGIITAHHAWCVTDDGRVVDPTWRDRGELPVREWEYLGVPLDYDFVCKTIARKGTYGVLDDHEIMVAAPDLPEGAIA